MESTTKNRKRRPQIEAMAGRAFGGTPLMDGEDAVRELNDGWFNAAYTVRLADGRDVILKIAPPPTVDVLAYERNIMATEVAAMRLVRQDPGIPVPEVYFYDDAHDICDSDYCFMQKMAGDALEHVKTTLPAETRTSLELEVGAIIRRVNGFTGSYFGYAGNPELRATTWREAFIRIVDAALDDGARKRWVYDYDYAAIRAAVRRHASALEEVTTPCLIHYDAWDMNVLVQDARITGIIDWERALWADPLMETQFRPLSSGAGITNGMRGYGMTSFTREEERRCWLYTLHYALVMNTECAYRNYDTDRVATFTSRLIGRSMEWLKAN